MSSNFRVLNENSSKFIFPQPTGTNFFGGGYFGIQICDLAALHYIFKQGQCLCFKGKKLKKILHLIFNKNNESLAFLFAPSVCEKIIPHGMFRFCTATPSFILATCVVPTPVKTFSTFFVHFCSQNSSQNCVYPGKATITTSIQTNQNCNTIEL